MSFNVNPLEQGRSSAAPEYPPNPRDVRRSKLGSRNLVRRWCCRYGCLEDIRCMMVGDYHIGRGSRERGLGKSAYSNDYKVSQYGRERAISQFAQKLQRDAELRAKLWTLSGLRLVCHCKSSQACHSDSTIEEFRRVYPGAFDREDPEVEPPKSEMLKYLARLRMEPAPEDDSSADEEVPEKGEGWRGTGPAMSLGEGYAAREYCDGQSLASPGRWQEGATQRPNCGRRSRDAS